MDEKDIQKVLEYVRDFVPSIDIDASDRMQADQAYGIWAIEEILVRIFRESSTIPGICEKPQLSVKEVIENFRDDMIDMAERSTNDHTRNIFEIAKVEADCMLLYVFNNERNIHEQSEH